MSSQSPVSVVSPISQARRNAESHVMPGTADLGAGLDVFGEYCAAGGLKLPIIDMSDRSQTIEGTSFVTSKLLTARPRGSGMAQRISGSSQREFSKNFSSKLDLEGECGFFSGELHAALDQSSSQKSDTSFEQFNEQIYLWQILLPGFTELRDHMLPRAKADFEGDMTPEELVRSYGTHYLRSALIGARSSFSCSINTSTFESSTSVSATVEAAYKGLVAKASGKVSAEQQTAMKQIDKSATYKVRIVGGDPKLAKNILDGDHAAWRASIEENMQIVDMAGGMAPISELVEDASRRAAVADAIMAAQSTHSLPDLPSLVPVTGYVDTSPRRWCFTPDPKMRPPGFAPYETTFYAFREPQKDTVPIYLKTKLINGHHNSMLSLDREAREGWPEGELAFHVYLIGGAMRKKIHAYVASNPLAQGWYFSPRDVVKGWSRRDDFGFFVPAV